MFIQKCNASEIERETELINSINSMLGTHISISPTSYEQTWNKVIQQLEDKVSRQEILTHQHYENLSDIISKWYDFIREKETVLSTYTSYDLDPKDVYLYRFHVNKFTYLLYIANDINASIRLNLDRIKFKPFTITNSQDKFNSLDIQAINDLRSIPEMNDIPRISSSGNYDFTRIFNSKNRASMWRKITERLGKISLDNNNINRLIKVRKVLTNSIAYRAAYIDTLTNPLSIKVEVDCQREIGEFINNIDNMLKIQDNKFDIKECIDMSIPSSIKNTAMDLDFLEFLKVEMGDKNVLSLSDITQDDDYDSKSITSYASEIEPDQLYSGAYNVEQMEYNIVHFVTNSFNKLVSKYGRESPEVQKRIYKNVNFIRKATLRIMQIKDGIIRTEANRWRQRANEYEEDKANLRLLLTNPMSGVTSIIDTFNKREMDVFKNDIRQLKNVVKSIKHTTNRMSNHIKHFKQKVRINKIKGKLNKITRRIRYTLRSKV